MSPIRFIMLGGFLGAGKTTLIARLARHYQGRGLKVGAVTNDQAADLVDTNSLRAQGLAVEEVPGACFCCHFNDLIAKADRLRDAEMPDVILAEPVGSCTDLVATVVSIFAVALGVLCGTLLLAGASATGRLVGDATVLTDRRIWRQRIIGRRGIGRDRSG